MNVQLPEGTGHSFKGVLSYLTHDKRQEGEATYRTTADRVAWTGTRNLPTRGPQTAMRFMIDTAQRADELKMAAGIKSTGRKATGGAVYHFSINYHPDERGGNPTRDDMMRTADQVLKILGFEDLQAVLVCHHETGNPHVHVVVNRVHPITGKMISAGPSRGRALDRWSHDFEVEGGQIFSHDRAAKYAELDKKKALHPDPDDRRKYIDQKKAANDPTTKSPLRGAWQTATARTTQGGSLKQKADALKVRHIAERAADWAWYKAAKDALWNTRPNFKAIGNQHRADTKPQWSAFGKMQAAERKAFYANERSLIGVFVNAERFIKREGWQWGMKGYLGVLFKAAVQPAAWRKKIMLDNQAKDKAAFVAQMDAAFHAKVNAAKTAHGAKIDQLNTQYDTKKRITAARHADERSVMRGEWTAYFERREASPKARRKWTTRSGGGVAPAKAKGAWQRSAAAPAAQDAPRTKARADWQSNTASKARSSYSKPAAKARDSAPDRSPKDPT